MYFYSFTLQCKFLIVSRKFVAINLGLHALKVQVIHLNSKASEPDFESTVFNLNQNKLMDMIYKII